MVPADQLFSDKHKSNDTKKWFIIIDDTLIDTLWYQFSYDLDVKSDFGKIFVRKKLVRWNHSYIKYALDRHWKALESFQLSEWASAN